MPEGHLVDIDRCRAPASDPGRQRRRTVQHFLQNWGYGAVFVLTVLESMCIPIPSEVTLGLGGALASRALVGGAHGHLDLALVILVGVLGSTLGSLVAYVVGRSGGRGLLDRYGPYLRVTDRDLERAEGWFHRRGELMVLYGRVIPFIRTFISLPAGMAEMNVPRFLAFTTVGVTAWVAAVSSIGYVLGSNWNSMTRAIGDTGYVIAGVVVAAVAVLIVHAYRTRRSSASSQSTPMSATGRCPKLGP